MGAGVCVPKTVVDSSETLIEGLVATLYKFYYSQLDRPWINPIF
jgi:hypothetical protein